MNKNSDKKGKTYKEIYGAEKANEIRKKQSETIKKEVYDKSFELKIDNFVGD